MLIFFIITILVIVVLVFVTSFTLRKKEIGKQHPTFLIYYDKGLGNYLTDSEGRTLYCFIKSYMETSNDDLLTNSKENHLGIWQIFYEKKIFLPPCLKKKDFSTVLKPDGQKQLAYKGHLLYYYGNDLEPGEVKGEGINNMWFTVKIS